VISREDVDDGSHGGGILERRESGSGILEIG
jgi:hypothetical protein